MSRRQVLRQIAAAPFLFLPAHLVSENRRVVEVSPSHLNDSNDVTNALEALLNDQSVAALYLRKGTYKISRPMVVHRGLELNLDTDAVIDGSGIPAFHSVGSHAILDVQGSTSVPVRFGDPILEGVSHLPIPLGQHPWMAGDLLVVVGNVPFLDLLGAETTASKLGYLHRIRERTLSSVVLDDEHLYSIPNSTSVSITPVKPVTDLRIRGGTIVGGGKSRCHTGIRLRYCSNAVIEDVSIDGCEDMGINVSCSYGISVTRPMVRNATSPGSPKGNTGYGIAAMDGARHIHVLDGRFHNCRHAVAGGGRIWSANVLVVGNNAEHCGIGTPAFDCHEPCHAWRFERNSVTGGDGGFIVRGQLIQVVNNTVKNTRGVGIRVRSYVRTKQGVSKVSLIANCIHDTGGRGISVEANEAPIGTIRIEQNSVADSTDAGIYVDPGKDLVVANNIIIRGKGRGFRPLVVSPDIQATVANSNTVLSNDGLPETAKSQGCD